MYIAIERIKGTGKSTLLQQLINQLQRDGIQFDTFCPTKPMPEHTWWEQAKDRFIHDPQFVADLYTVRANYHAARVDFSVPLVIGDRSILTSLVTRWPTKHQDIEQYVQQVKLKEYQVPMPDHVCYLDAPLEYILPRLAIRQRDYGKHDETFERLQQAKQAYEQVLCYQHVEWLKKYIFLR